MLKYLKNTFQDCRNNASYGRLASLICLVSAIVFASLHNGYTTAFLMAAGTFYGTSKAAEVLSKKEDKV